jgi:hypothetical protein
MANNKESRRTFKYGDREYYVDDLLKLHADQFSHYLNFAKERGLYNDSALVGLRESILSRIEAIKSGQSFEGDGVLGSDHADNITIETKGRGRKNLTINQDNTEWSKHYINKLVATLTPVDEQQATSNGWDSAKYGLGAYLTAQGLNAQEIFENYDVGDGTSVTRTSTERRNLLKSYLSGYYNWLLERGFDFESDDNDWNNTFLEDFNQFLTDYDTLDDNAIATRLRKFGAGDAYATAFTSNRWDLTKTREQLEEEARAAEDSAKEAAKNEAWNNYVKQQYDIYSRNTDNNPGGTFFTTKGDGKFEMTQEEYNKWWQDTPASDRRAYLTDLQNRYLTDPFNKDVAAEWLPILDFHGGTRTAVIDGVTYKYDPDTIDRAKNRVAVVNPETGEMKHVFLWDLEDELATIKDKWLMDNGYEDAYAKYQVHKLGGTISMQTGGKFDIYRAAMEYDANLNAEKAKASGRTEEQQRAMDRVVSTGEAPLTSADPTLGQPDAGFTTADKVRLASILVDVGSFLLPPTAGTVAGVGSSLMNFGSDIADDGFQWGDVGNLAINVGLDLVSWIPVVGDAVGTGTKVIRKLVKYVPKAMAYIGAIQGLANSEAILNSFQKLTSGDAAAKMTVQDWRNIYQGLHLITSGATALKNKRATNNTLKQAKLEDSVGVTVVGKDGKKQLLVNGEAAEKIRAANGDKATIEEVLSNTSAFKDQVGKGKAYQVVTSASGIFKGWRFPVGKDKTGSWQLRSPRTEGKAQVVDIYDFGKLKTGENPLTMHQQATEWGVTPYSKKDQIDLRSTEANLNAQIDRVRKANERRVVVDPETGKVTRKTADRSDVITQTKKEIAELEAKLNGVKRDQVQQDLSSAGGRVKGVESLEKEIKDANKHAEILASQIETSKQKIAESQKKGVYPYREFAKLDSLQRQLDENVKNRANLSQRLDDLTGFKEQEAAYRQGLQTTLQDFGALDRAKARLHRQSQKQKADIKASKAPTRAYTKLEQMINDINANLNVKLDMKKILEGAGIPDAFKDGGSISRHKMNKFLNYAKR